MSVDPQQLGQFFGYVIVVAGAHWVTRGGVKDDLATLRGDLHGLAQQIAGVAAKLDTHDRRIDAMSGRIDFLWMMNGGKSLPGEPPDGVPERRRGYPGKVDSAPESEVSDG